MASGGEALDILWDRSTLGVPHALGVTVVYGHTPTPDFEVLWTYPEDGDQGVPRNAQLWVLTSQWGNAPMVTRPAAPVATAETSA